MVDRNCKRVRGGKHARCQEGSSSTYRLIIRRDSLTGAISIILSYLVNSIEQSPCLCLLPKFQLPRLASYILVPTNHMSVYIITRPPDF